MNRTRLMTLLYSPCMTEKSSRLSSDRQYMFRVRKDARKADIKQAVELMFSVKVEKVRVCNVQGKRKMFKRIRGRRPSWKKAWVTLDPGHTIDFGGV